MKIHILHNFQKGPWGGGNQFLKALKKEFEKQDIYEEDSERADVVLFNSYPFGAEYLFDKILKLKNKYPSEIIFYRLDGPISVYRGRDKEIDTIITIFSNLFVDGIIFQSNWCKEQNKKLFGISSSYETVIYNAAYNTIFNRTGKKEFNPSEKIKLIAISWSSNWRKGFDLYRYLDDNLDFSRYEITFVGNTPIKFKNIKWIKPVPSKKLSEILKQHDIYLTASQNDPCSNSLIEAVSCGLPAVALNDGGHPELIKNGGELFEGEKDVIEKIEKVAKNYHYYQTKIEEFSIKKVAHGYYKFAEKIFKDMQNEKYKSKQVDFLSKINFYKMKFMILKWKTFNKMKSRWKR